MSDAETQQIDVNLGSSWIQTYTGKLFDPFNPNPDDIDIEDIAHALSLTCRFGGHCNTFYSVAEHSIRVAILCEDQLAGLLHDATEAYLCDIPRPIKRMIPQYKDIERNLCVAIFEKFGLDTHHDHVYPDEVVAADDIMLATEKRDLLLDVVDWGLKAEPLEKEVCPVGQREAYDRFLDMFSRLTTGEQAVPSNYWVYHHQECDTAYRGCSPKCSMYKYEMTGRWEFPEL